MTHTPKFSVSIGDKMGTEFTDANAAYDYAVSVSGETIVKVYVEDMFKHNSWIFQYAV